VQDGDVAVCGELEVECQPGGAAGKVAGDVDVRVVACVGGDDVVDGVGDSGDLGAPGADGVDPDPLDAFVLDDGVFGELGEVCVDVGLRARLKYRPMSVLLSVMFLHMRRGCQVVGRVPPSRTYSAPVMERARSETRKATSSAVSSGCAGRPSGMPPRESMIC
jgi:hypothetical protein